MALYHKYRPQSFDSIVGQGHIIKTITNQIRIGKVTHAYLFSGPRGIGKTTTARLLAKALNCQNRKEKSFEPCNECESCKEISGSRALDVIEIDAASHTGVDNVRENIIENSQFRPVRSKYKVFIVDEVHMLSTSAFNALLKTLEEPPDHVILILATTEPHKLPETIISRCQHNNFKKISYETLQKHLLSISKEEKVKIDKDVIDRIVNKSDGCVRDAVSLLDQIIAIGEKTITSEIASVALPTSQVDEVVSLLTSLINKNEKEGIIIVNNLANQGIRFVNFIDEVIELLRTMMIMKATSKNDTPGVDFSDKVKKELNKLNGQINQIEIVYLIDLFIKRRQEVQSSPLPQLPIELAIIEWCCINNNSKPSSENSDYINIPSIEKPKNNNSLSLEKEDGDGKFRATGKKITETVKKLVSKDKEPVCTVQDIKNVWHKFLKELEGEFPSLVFILKMTEIMEINGNSVCLGVQYSLHRDKLSERKCQKHLESCLSKFLDKKIKLDVQIREKKLAESVDEEVQELASVLGGEIVR